MSTFKSFRFTVDEGIHVFMHFHEAKTLQAATEWFRDGTHFSGEIVVEGFEIPVSKNDMHRDSSRKDNCIFVEAK